jgi:hypothetical protein
MRWVRGVGLILAALALVRFRKPFAQIITQGQNSTFGFRWGPRETARSEIVLIGIAIWMGVLGILSVTGLFE